MRSAASAKETNGQRQATAVRSVFMRASLGEIEDSFRDHAGQSAATPAREREPALGEEPLSSPVQASVSCTSIDAPAPGSTGCDRFCSPAASSRALATSDAMTPIDRIAAMIPSEIDVGI